MAKRSAEINEHWERLRAIGCIVTGAPYPHIHHCCGGSMLDLGITKGMGCKVSDWLVIPLAPELHSMGPRALHQMGVKTWELIYGRQVDLLEKVRQIIGVDIWAKAGVDR